MIDMKRFASVGLDKDVILSEDVVQTISQFLRLGVATDRPADGIIFWSFRNIPKIFKSKLEYELISIWDDTGYNFINNMSFNEYDETNYQMIDDLRDTFHKVSACTYLLRHREGVEHDIREIYEDLYRDNFIDVVFGTYDEEGMFVQSYLHTPFILTAITMGF